MSIAVVDAKTVKMVRRKGTDVIGETTATVSADGKTLTFDWKNSPVGKTSNHRQDGGDPGGCSSRRVHTPCQGLGRRRNLRAFPKTGLTFTFAVDGDTVKMNAKTGESYEAKLGGPEVAVAKDEGGTW